MSRRCSCGKYEYGMGPMTHGAFECIPDNTPSIAKYLDEQSAKKYVADLERERAELKKSLDHLTTILNQAQQDRKVELAAVVAERDALRAFVQTAICEDVCDIICSSISLCEDGRKLLAKIK